jgi:hypothetical protein
MPPKRLELCSSLECSNYGPLKRGLCSRCYRVWWNAHKHEVRAPKPIRTSKTCTRCLEDKVLLEFSIDRANTTGYKSHCRKCCTIDHREWREKNRQYYREYKRRRNALYPQKHDPEYRRQHYINVGRGVNMLRQYGITEAEFDALLVSQGGGCAICGRLDSGLKNRRMSVDHCHKTGKIRGILCAHCNHGLGKFNDDPDLMTVAITYLLRHSEDQREAPAS